MATTTSHVLKGLMWNGPNCWLGSTGRITPDKSRNLAKVRISCGAMLAASFSRAAFRSSRIRLATASVVANQKWP